MGLLKTYCKLTQNLRQTYSKLTPYLLKTYSILTQNLLKTYSKNLLQTYSKLTLIYYLTHSYLQLHLATLNYSQLPLATPASPPLTPIIPCYTKPPPSTPQSFATTCNKAWRARDLLVWGGGYEIEYTAKPQRS